MKLRPAIGATLLAFALAGNAAAQDSGSANAPLLEAVEQRPTPVVTRLQGSDLQGNFSALLEALHSEGLLPTKVVSSSRAFKSIGAVFAEGIGLTVKDLPGRTVSPQLDRLLCDLNPHICTHGPEGVRSSLQSAPADAPPIAETVCRRALERFELCVPDLKIGRYETILFYKFNRERENLEDIVVQRARGCEALDTACQALIDALNPEETKANALPDSPRHASILLPTAAYRIEFLAPNQHAAERAVDVIRKAEQALGEQGKLAEQQDNIRVELIGAPFRIMSLGGAPAMASADAVIGSVSAEPNHDNAAALALMSFPLDDKGLADLPPIHVGVWDTRADLEHCDFREAPGRSAWLVVDPDPTAPASTLPDRAAACDGGLSPDTNAVVDHATKVVGLIGSRVNGVGIAGVNPSAWIWNYETSSERLVEDKDIMMGRLRKNALPKVVNISLMRSATDDASLRKYIRSDWAETTLFVVAAGNDGRTFPDPADPVASCNVVPACWSQLNGRVNGQVENRNIISVVALAADGVSLLPSSNRGPAFDLAAIGDLVSTAYGDRYARFIGTSAATPLVTGLASLIYADVAEKLYGLQPAPWRVKDRMVATADFLPSLAGQVRFGRVNFKRALAYRTDLVAPRGCVDESCVRVVKVDHRRNLNLVMTRASRRDDGSAWQSPCQRDGPICLKTNDLRRLIFVETAGGEDFYLAVVLDKGEEVVLKDVTFAANQTLGIAEAGGPMTQRPIQEIQDYTACSFADACEGR